MTNAELIGFFELHPAPTSPVEQRTFSWFNYVTSALGLMCPKAPHRETLSGAFVAWKHKPEVSPQSRTHVHVYDNVCLVEFKSLYISTLLVADDFVDREFSSLIIRLQHIRQSELLPADVRRTIKCYLNSIFGQLNVGSVRCKTITQNDVVDIARTQVERIYAHPNSVYADTDGIVICDAFDAVCDWAVGCIDSAFPYSVAEYDKFELRGVKRGVQFFGKGREINCNSLYR